MKFEKCYNGLIPVRTVRRLLPMTVCLLQNHYHIVFAGLAKFEDNLLSQINNQEAIIDTLKGRLEAKDKQARPLFWKLTLKSCIGYIHYDPPCIVRFGQVSSWRQSYSLVNNDYRCLEWVPGIFWIFFFRFLNFFIDYWSKSSIYAVYLVFAIYSIPTLYSVHTHTLPCTMTTKWLL